MATILDNVIDVHLLDYVEYLEGLSLEELIKNSRAMKESGEMDWWLDNLDNMTDEQKYKLKRILIDEKIRLKEIDLKYKKKKIDLLKSFLNNK